MNTAAHEVEAKTDPTANEAVRDGANSHLDKGGIQLHGKTRAQLKTYLAHFARLNWHGSNTIANELGAQQAEHRTVNSGLARINNIVNPYRPSSEAEGLETTGH